MSQPDLPEWVAGVAARLTREFLHPALLAAGMPEPESYALAWGMMPVTSDPWGLVAFEQARHRYFPVWRHVPGGRAAHAFIGGNSIPACGIEPMRGNPPHPSRWVSGGGRRPQHGVCARLVREHQETTCREQRP